MEEVGRVVGYDGDRGFWKGVWSLEGRPEDERAGRSKRVGMRGCEERSDERKVVSYVYGGVLLLLSLRSRCPSLIPPPYLRIYIFLSLLLI